MEISSSDSLGSRRHGAGFSPSIMQNGRGLSSGELKDVRLVGQTVEQRRRQAFIAKDLRILWIDPQD